MASLEQQRRMLQSLGFGFVEVQAPIEEEQEPARRQMIRPNERRPPPPRPAPARPDEPPLASLPALPVDRRAAALEALATKATACEACTLYLTRHRAATGVGRPDAPCLMVWETPLEEQDRGGSPFDGPIGNMFADIVEKGMKWRREEVFVTFAAKCRPPGNRTPQEKELQSCRPFLREQIEIIRPRVIVVFGLDAAAVLLGLPRGEVLRRRGQWHDYRGTPLMPTFPLPYIFQNTVRKRTVWQDLQEVLKQMG